MTFVCLFALKQQMSVSSTSFTHDVYSGFFSPKRPIASLGFLKEFSMFCLAGIRKVQEGSNQSKREAVKCFNLLLLLKKKGQKLYKSFAKN